MVVLVRQRVVHVNEVEFETVGDVGGHQPTFLDERVDSPDGRPVAGDVSWSIRSVAMRLAGRAISA